TQLRRQVGRPELLALDLGLERADEAHEAGLIGVHNLQGVDLVVDELAHPLELLLELGLGREIPGHQAPLASSAMPSAIMPVMVSVSPSYMGSGRLPRRCSMRL